MSAVCTSPGETCTFVKVGEPDRAFVLCAITRRHWALWSSKSCAFDSSQAMSTRPGSPLAPIAGKTLDGASLTFEVSHVAPVSVEVARYIVVVVWFSSRSEYA